MKHRLSSFAIRLWLLRLSGKHRNMYGERSTEVHRIRSDARHLIAQGSRDCRRRGLSNREGSRNRRWRAYEATLVRVGVVEWPSMRVGSALVSGRAAA
jgi:hypothetical protein